MGTSLLGVLDVAIGVSLVMILLSTVVSGITHAVLSAWYARARYLRAGLTELISQIDRTNLQEHSASLAALVLRHPAVGRDVGRVLGWITGPFRSQWNRLRGYGFLPVRNPGTVVERHELVRILLEIAAGEWNPADDPAKSSSLDQASLGAVRQKLVDALAAAGIADPKQTLTEIRDRAQELQLQQPTETVSKLMSQAILEKAKSQFVGRLTGWFDQTMDRTTQRFTLEARSVTVFTAFFVAVFLQVDSLALITRLSVDEAFRASLVEQAKTLQDVPAPSGDATQQLQDVRATLAKFNEPALAGIVKPVWTKCTFNATWQSYKWDARVVGWVWDGPAWLIAGVAEALEQPSPAPGIERRLPVLPAGLLLSWLLLTFGAPFWFDALKNLLKLRPLLAQKEAKQREGGS